MRRVAFPGRRIRIVLLSLTASAAVFGAVPSGTAGPAGIDADTVPPSVPQAMAFSGRSRTTVSLVWRAARDNVGVKGYRLFRNGRAVATVTQLRYTYRGLECGTSYTFALEAYDVAGNASYRPEAVGRTATLACVRPATPKPKPSPPAARPTPAPGSALANLWVDTNGGACARHPRAVAYRDAQACPSLAAAYRAASTGDTVVVAAGTYGPQALRAGTKTLTIRNAPGAVPVLGTTKVDASNIKLIGFKIERNDDPDGAATLEARGANNTFNRIHVNTKNVYGRQGIYARGDNNTFRNGSTYNVTDEKAAWISGAHVTFNNFNFYNTYATGPQIHNECAYVIDAEGFTIRNSKFWRCPTMALYLTRGSWYQAPPWGNVTIENNVVGHSTDTGREDSWHYYGFVFSGALSYDGAPLKNFKVRYNTFEQSVSLDPSLKAVGASEFVGNVGGGWSCIPGMSYRYNVGTKCSATDRAISPSSSCGRPACARPVTAAYRWADPANQDFHLTVGSPAINAGDPKDHPRTDKDGKLRAAGTAPDAGAYEQR